MNIIRSRLSLLVAAACLLGCGGSAAPPSPAGESTPEVQSTEQLRDRLQQIADSGVTGSGLAGVDAIIAQIPDAAKKSALEADYAKLQQAEKPTAIKKIASDMIAKL